MSNTGNSLAIVERNLAPIESRLDHLVSAVGLDAKRFQHQIMMAFEKIDVSDFHVGQCVNFAQTSCVLALEPDGVTGQMFPIPFRGRNPVIQPVIGYKGFNTTAGRAGITIVGDALREGDQFDTRVQAGKPFSVEMRFGDRQQAPIIGAWAQAVMPNGLFSSPVLLDLSEIKAVMAKSAGAKKRDSPWNDAHGPGFGAMCAKTAKRRLQRSLPTIVTPGLERGNISQHMIGAVMDETHDERGLYSHADHEGNVITGQPIIQEQEPEPTAYLIHHGKEGVEPTRCKSISEYAARLTSWMRNERVSAEAIRAAMKRNRETMADLSLEHEMEIAAIEVEAETQIAAKT